MKRIAETALVLIIVLTGCVEDNPFNAGSQNNWEGGGSYPHIVQQGTWSGGSGSHVLSDMDPDAAGVQDAMVLTFDQPMDPATLTAGDFVIESTTGIPATVTPDEIIYAPENGTVTLHATFQTETAYLLTAPAGASMSIAGKQLDANHNALYDGSPWDDSRFTFFNGSAVEADIIHPTINDHWPTGGGNTNQRPDITILFANGPMDVSMLTAENFYMVKTSDSSAVNAPVTIASAGQITIVPTSDLGWGERYTLRLRARVDDSAGNTLDVPPIPWVWPDEPDYTWDFQMDDDATSHKTPPTVSQAVLTTDYVVVTFEESLTGNSVVMDTGSFNATNIQLYDDLGMIPLQYQASPAEDEVYCYPERPVGAGATIWISAYTLDQYGNPLDGNNDGLGGTPGEDDWSTTF